MALYFRPMFVIDQSLRAYNSFGINALAKRYIAVDSREALQDLLSKVDDPPALLLGGGSNVLLMNDVEGWTLHNRIGGIEIVEEASNEVLLAVGGGVIWQDLVDYCLEHNYGGIENLSLIPGSVGAAPVQNIGAYGVELANVFSHLEAVDLANGELLTFDKSQCEFGYRDSIFKRELKGKVCIAKVFLRLTRQKHQIDTSYGIIERTLADWNIYKATIQEVSRAVIHIRKSKLPDWREMGNAGSFFKNPIVEGKKAKELLRTYPDMPNYRQGWNQIKLAAGWLIDQAGWRGKQMGPVGSYEKQALVLVNFGGASGADVWKLAQAIQADVSQKFGVDLEPEVNLIG